MWKHKKRNENKGKDTLHFVIIKRPKPNQETIDKGVKVLKPNSSVKYYPVQWFFDICPKNRNSLHSKHAMNMYYKISLLFWFMVKG